MSVAELKILSEAGRLGNNMVAKFPNDHLCSYIRITKKESKKASKQESKRQEEKGQK